MSVTVTASALTTLSSVVTPAKSSAVVLAVRGASVRYGERRALNAVDIQVAAGELCVLLGPNGAGKTTLLRAIVGRVPLVAGSIQVLGNVLGQDPANDVAARAQIGLVPQEIAVYGHLTVRENLEVFARLAGVARPHIAERVSEALAMCRLTERTNDYVRALSGGLKRLTNIGCAILHRPRLLILDEPTVGVDVDAQGTLNAALAGLRERGMALLMTTHDLEQAEALATQAVFLVRGEVVGAGPPGVLLEQAFGVRHVLLVTLRHEPSAAERELFAGLQLHATRVPTVWSALAAPESASATVLAAKLRENHIRVREMRVREPDLASLYMHLTGETAAA